MKGKEQYLKFKDYTGCEVVISMGRIRHVLKGHPDIKAYSDKVEDVLISPEVVMRVDKPAKDVLLYCKRFPEISENYLVIALRAYRSSKTKKYVRTMYLTLILRNDGVAVHDSSKMQ